MNDEHSTGAETHSDEVAFWSASELVAALATGELSSRELLDLYLARIERLNPALRAVVTLDEDATRAAAAAADEARARAGDVPLGPLHGLPMTVMDSIETAGMRTTSGAPFLADHVPGHDADAVARLRRAGAVVFGKTNLPMFAADVQTTNELFGTTVNPWNPERTPGGSSGGSAAAVAAGLTGLELGSDLGGSLRMPAHFCGVYTVKPTYGLVPGRGHIPPEPGTLAALDIASFGPLARSADDLDRALAVLAGPDAARAVAWRVSLPAPRRHRLADYRVAAWLDDPYCSVDHDLAELLAATVAELRAAGVVVTEVGGAGRDGPGAGELPMSLAEGHGLAQQLTQGAVGVVLPPADYDALRERADGAGPGDDSPPVRFARNITQRARALGQAAEQRLRLRAGWARFFEHYDVLLTPVTPATAFPHDHHPDVDARTIVVNGARRPYGDQFAWVQSFGALHLPAVVAPVGRAADGLPVGVQIVGPYLEDRTPIDVARRLAEVVGGFERPPGW
jgi:amidase